MGYDRTWTSPRTWSAEILTSADLNSNVRDNLLFLKENIALETATELTIAAGAVTKTKCYHDIDTAEDGATDDLDTISGGAEGDILFIRPENAARTVIVKHNTGNIWNPSAEDITLDDIDDGVLLLYGANSKWLVLGGGSASDLAAHIADSDPHTQYQKESEKGAASGYASLNGSTKVTEQPASISDHLENPPTEDLATKTATSEYIFDHNARNATALVQGHATAAQITKLDGIEALADVTDITNINAALIDDVALQLGTGGTAKLLYETADANANCLILALPDGGATDVPVLVIGDQSVINKDLTRYNGITVPTLALENADETANIRINATGIYSSGNLIIQPNADLDDYFTFATVSDIPTIYGTGAYLRIGDAATTSHALASEDDLMVSGKLEIDGNSYFDGTAQFSNFYIGNGNSFSALNVDNSLFLITARDNGVTIVSVAAVIGAADPYLRIGRDDTGVATNSVTDMFYLRAGAGTNNEAANFGLGIPVYLGNAASQVEERASLDFVLTDATDGSEDVEINFNLQIAGAAAAEVLSIVGTGMDLPTGKVLSVAGTQVVGARVVDARCDDVINSGDATTDGVIDALRDAMIAHGLIAAA